MAAYVQYELAPLDPILGGVFLFLVANLLAHMKLLADISVYPEDKTMAILNPPKKSKFEKHPIFDFIIIGASTSGCIVANRLAQYQDWKVLLIEAGDYPKAATEVPSLHTKLKRSKDVWTFEVEKATNSCLGMKRCKLYRGHVLGGYSTVNNLHYTRGLPSDFDSWDSDIWGSRMVHKANENIENFYSDTETEVEYGTNGEIPLANVTCSCVEKFTRQLLEDGYKYIGCHRIPRNTYVGYKEQVLTLKDGKRANNAKTFLEPLKTFKNFSLMTKTRVRSILTNNPVDKRASAVEIETSGGVIATIGARKDIILATGAINTPKLLMLSGIGPRDDLERLKIDFVADLPVGMNLQIHVSVPVYVSIDCCTHNDYDCRNITVEEVDSIFQYTMYRKGSMAKIGVHDFVAYVNTKRRDYPLPSVVNYHHYYRVNDSNFKRHIEDMEYMKGINESLLNANKNACIIQFDVTLLNPNSVGQVKLKDACYEKDPSIKTNFFTDESSMDYGTILVGVKKIISMIESQPFVDVNASFVLLDMPSCRNYKFCTDHYLKCYIQHLSHPTSDVSSTVPMGLMCDFTKVVTDNLEVKQVRGLRVIDASIMPKIVSADLEGSTAAIGEMGAEFVKQKWIKDYPPVYKFEEECVEVELEEEED